MTLNLFIQFYFLVDVTYCACTLQHFGGLDVVELIMNLIFIEKFWLEDG